MEENKSTANGEAPVGEQIKTELDKFAQWSKKSFSQFATWTTKEVSRASKEVKDVASRASKEVKDSGRKVKLVTHKVKETMGKTSKTVDTEVELQVTSLREMLKDYHHLCAHTRTVTKHACLLAKSQAALAETYAHIAERDLAVRAELVCASKVNELVAKNANSLNEATRIFQERLGDFLKKRVEETLSLYDVFQSKRLEYDAFRSDYDAIKDDKKLAGSPRVGAAEQKFLTSYNTFQEARSTLVRSIEALSSDKVALMKSQLNGLVNATCLFASGNHAGCEQALAVLKQAQQELLSKTVDNSYVVKPTEPKKGAAGAAASGHTVDGEED